jgi:hypothetical protein
MPVLGNIIKKRGLFWLMVLVQGQEPASSDGLLAGRVPRHHMARDREHVFVSSGLPSSVKAVIIGSPPLRHHLILITSQGFTSKHHSLIKFPPS